MCSAYGMEGLHYVITCTIITNNTTYNKQPLNISNDVAGTQLMCMVISAEPSIPRGMELPGSTWAPRVRNSCSFPWEQLHISLYRTA